MPDWDSSEGPVIYSCSPVSLHLVGKSFLGKWGRLKRQQGEVLRSLGASCLSLSCSAPRPFRCRPQLSLSCLLRAESHLDQAFSQLLQPAGFLVLRWMSFVSSFSYQLQCLKKYKLDPLCQRLGTDPLLSVMIHWNI